MSDNSRPTFILPRLEESKMALFAQLLAVIMRPGDVIALEGDVGAGKTTFARAFIRAFLGNDVEEIPSPTYTLVQTYETERMKIAHFDLYRLNDPSELGELGLDHALAEGIAIIEWPEQAGDLLPKSRLTLQLRDPSEDNSGNVPSGSAVETRDVAVLGIGNWEERARRLGAMHQLICSSHRWANLSAISYLAGDASARRYARLVSRKGERALVMDWPHKPDLKILREGKSYNQLAHITDNVLPFIAIANVLQEQGFAAPQIQAYDEKNGFVILEDLGEQVFFDEVHKGASMADLWRVGTEALVALRAATVPKKITVSGSGHHQVPHFDRGAIVSELELLADWYWPSVHGSPMPEEKRAHFFTLWNDVIDKLLAEPPHWCLRDYHSPNLVWLPERTGNARVGIIDFQDACSGPAAYDLVSLLQDARASVPETIESDLLEHYCTLVLRDEPLFDRAAFTLSYAALGAQRNTKILGIFARLAKRDGKPRYLAHIPRIWGYLNRNLQHAGLSKLANWYDEAFDTEVRGLSASN